MTDKTYFGSASGVMDAKDSMTGQILHKPYVKRATNNLYLCSAEETGQRGIKTQSIICDGRKKLFQLLGNIPT